MNDRREEGWEIREIVSVISRENLAGVLPCDM